MDIFLEIKGKSIPELKNESWIRDLAFIVDVTYHLNNLNLKLQGKGQFIHQLYKHIKKFQNKLQLWESQLCNGNSFHFITLANHRTPDYATFPDDLLLISTEFSDKFQDFKSQEL